MVVFTIVVVVAIGYGTWLYLNPQNNDGKQLEHVTVSYPKFESMTLFWVAEEQGFFAGNGLNVTSQVYVSGADALSAVAVDKADIALGVSEYPLAVRVLHQEKLSAFAIVDKAEFTYIVARADRGIATVSDLAGRRIGIVSGTIAEFYLGRTLELHGINIRNVTLVDLKTPDEWVKAIVDGDIDAVSIAQPSVNLIVNSLGGNAVILPVQSSQQMYILAITKDDWRKSNPEIINKFLSALLQAEEYTLTNPSKAKAIVKEKMGFTDEYIETVWKQNVYIVSLDQSLVIAMEDEARWMIINGLTEKSEIPNFTNNISEDALKTLRPERVNIIR
jgi:ABC-type nitrate/sulfonate/bicarbonate transport system substrate-binding protein